MHKKAYISNIDPAWPLARQREMIAGIEAVYEDKLTPAALKRRDPAELKDRKLLLRPTSRRDPEMIVIASINCLAWTWEDLCDVVVQAAARHATIHEASSGWEFKPGDGAGELARRLPTFARQKRARGLVKSREEFNRERMEDSRRRAETIRPYWHLPNEEWPRDKLLEMAGRDGKPMALHTAQKYLGNRYAAQKEHALRARQQAGRLAAIAKKKGTPNG